MCKRAFDSKSESKFLIRIHFIITCSAMNKDTWLLALNIIMCIYSISIRFILCSKTKNTCLCKNAVFLDYIDNL